MVMKVEEIHESLYSSVKNLHCLEIHEIMCNPSNNMDFAVSIVLGIGMVKDFAVSIVLGIGVVKDFAVSIELGIGVVKDFAVSIELGIEVVNTNLQFYGGDQI
jgi:hypothetical protein